MPIKAEGALAAALPRGDIAISSTNDPGRIASRMIMVNTTVDSDKFLAMIEELPNKKYALHLVVHGESGGNPKPTLDLFKQFVRDLKDPSKTGAAMHQILMSLDEMHIGGDWNFSLTTTLPEDEGKVRGNRAELEQTLINLWPEAWNISAHYPQQVVNRQRADHPFDNSQIFKLNSTKPEPSDVLAAFYCRRTGDLAERTTVHVVKGHEAVLENSFPNVKLFGFGTGRPPEGQTYLDHGIITVPVVRDEQYQTKTLYVYTNIVPVYGWNGVNRGLPGIPCGELRDEYGRALQRRISLLAQEMIHVIDPEFTGAIESWSHPYHADTGLIEKFFIDVLSSQEYQDIAKLLFIEHDNQPFELSPFKAEERWQSDLVPYYAGDATSDLKKFVSYYMHNAKTSLGSVPPHIKTVTGNLTINKLANDILTGLSQQRAGGYTLAPQIIDALSRPNTSREAIQAEICTAQQDEVVRCIHSLQVEDPQIKEVVIFGIEVKKNVHFYPPQKPELLQHASGPALARHGLFPLGAGGEPGQMCPDSPLSPPK